MTHINQSRIPLGHNKVDLLERATKVLRIPSGEIEKLAIVKQSMDAREKPDIWYSYMMDIRIRQAELQKEKKLVRRLRDRNVVVHKETSYQLPEPDTKYMVGRSIIVGTGPAGLFYGLTLAREEYMSILLERGEDADARTGQVVWFWETGQPNPPSGAQFGEGGAGTFSDGKPNTLVKDIFGRNREVLRILTEFGKGPSILYVNKPHIGTDVLSRIVKSIQTKVERLRSQVLFQSQVTDFVTRGEPGESRHIKALAINGNQVLGTETMVLTIEHNAKGTFGALLVRGIPMEPKAFTVGLRVQHPRTLINESQYGTKECGESGPTSYELTWKASDEKGVYSFCMYPGDYAVNTPSEPDRLTVNGMSYHDRTGENANSAIIVTIAPEGLCGMETRIGTGRSREVPGDATAGTRPQKRLEGTAFCLGEGDIPIQLYDGFKKNRALEEFGGVNPAFRGGYAFADLGELFPEPLPWTSMEGMEGSGIMIRGSGRPDTILAGIENYTSSPVRIPRDQEMENPIEGILPCSKGTGCARGITSAAMDGAKMAEEVIRGYNSLCPSRTVAKT